MHPVVEGLQLPADPVQFRGGSIGHQIFPQNAAGQFPRFRRHGIQSPEAFFERVGLEFIVLMDAPAPHPSGVSEERADMQELGGVEGSTYFKAHQGTADIPGVPERDLPAHPDPGAGIRGFPLGQGDLA